LCRLGNLTPGYIIKLKERFESGSDDYNLTKEALKEFFKCRDNEIAVLFEMFDMDGNGSIDSYEFLCFLSLMSHGTLDEKAELIFNLYDFDKSQSISKDELTVLMTNALTALKSMDRKPAPTVSEIEKKTNAFFADADSNRDNSISLREFKSYIKKDKEILEVLTSYAIAKKSDLGTDFGSGNSNVPDCDSDLDEECHPHGLDDSDVKNKIKDGDMFEEEEAGAGDQAMVNLSGHINAMIPSHYRPSASDIEPPNAHLDLEYVFGIRVHDVRNNLRYNIDGKLVYNCAGVGVVMDKKANTQKHFMSHRDDIHCLAIDPTGLFAATGEIGPQPRLCVWNTRTMEMVHCTQHPLVKGIKHVAWSKDGRYVAATDMSDDHNIAIFDAKAELKPGQKWKPVAHGKGDRAVIMSLGFNAEGFVIATCIKAVIFFNWTKDGKINKKKGTGFTPTPCDTVLAQAFVNGTLFTGHKSGEIMGWSGSSVAKKTKAHTKKVNALAASETGNAVLISGGFDGQVCTW
jgi:Ca2+-binding EF-hand superfamily protein